MRDLQVIKLADAIFVNRVSVPADQPDAIRLEGTHMLGASVARINGNEVRYTVISDSMMDVYPPVEEKKTPIRSIDVLSDVFTGTAQSTLEFRLGTLRCAQGLLKLIQQFIAVLFSSAGRNIFHPNRGGGLLKLLGTNIDPSKPATYTSVVRLSVDKTTKDIFQSQSPRRIPDDERLKRVSVRSVFFDVDRAELLIKLEFESFAGRRALTAVAVS